MKAGGEDIDGDLMLADRLGLPERFVSGGRIEGSDDRCTHETS
jgi:hypothetical protein